MGFKVFERSSEGIQPVDWTNLDNLVKDQSKIYFVDILAKDRASIKDDLLTFGLLNIILEGILSPFEHIRFDYYNETLYGELAIFSSIILKEQYEAMIILGLINHGNWTILSW